MNPKISIIIPTLGRETLYPLVNNLLKQNIDYHYEIILIPQVKLKEQFLQDKKIKIYYEPLGKGFAYYRNIGIEKSKGEIITFIDDDELPMNNNWLKHLTCQIIKGEEKVITAGYKIKLNQGYVTDCVSLLGFPGGGAVGFTVMWPLESPPYTSHICSGNFAILRDTLLAVGCFDNALNYGNEDVALGDKLTEHKIRILYLEEATVYHTARKGLYPVIRWNILRGKSAADYVRYKKSKGRVQQRLYSSLRIILKVIKERPGYIPGVVFMMVSQYVFQSIGYIYRQSMRGTGCDREVERKRRL